MSVELKPCPFCGVEPVLSSDYFRRYDVRCLNADCKIMPATSVYLTPEDAAEVWNRRADQPRRIDGQPAGITAEQFDSIYEETD